MEEMSAGERPSPESEEGMRLREGSRERTRPEQEVRVVISTSDLVRRRCVSSGTQKEGCQTGGEKPELSS